MQLSRLREVLGSYPLIINTVPALLLDRDMLRTVRKDALILDLASKPGGDDVQDDTGSASPVGTEGSGEMPGKQNWMIAAGLGAVLVTVLITLLMQQPVQPVVVTVQTETPPVAAVGTGASAGVKTASYTTAPSVSASRTDQSNEKSKKEVLQSEAPDYNLNTADEAALQEVSGVGAVLAAEIIAYRDSAGGFIRRSQLLEIPGIGEVLAARIMEQFYIPDEQPDPAPEPEPPQEPEPHETESAPAEAQEQEYIVLDLNTAERDDLLQLPGMTEELADAILSLREQLGGYQNIHELLLVPGIKPEYVELTLKDYLYIE